MPFITAYSTARRERAGSRREVNGDDPAHNVQDDAPEQNHQNELAQQRSELLLGYTYRNSQNATALNEQSQEQHESNGNTTSPPDADDDDAQSKEMLVKGAMQLGRTIWPEAEESDILLSPVGRSLFLLIFSPHSDGVEFDFSTCQKVLLLCADSESGAPVSNWLAVVRCYTQSTRLPVDKILSSSTTDDNILRRPYVIYPYPAGEFSLDDAYPTLFLDQKLRVAKEMGDIFRHLLEVQHNVTGIIGFNEFDEVSVLPFEQNPRLNEVDEVKGYEDLWRFQSNPRIVKYSAHAALADTTHPEDLDAVYNVLIANLTTHLLKHPVDSPVYDLLKKLCVMVSELHQGGWLKGIKFTLVDPWLNPRHIHIKNTSVPEAHNKAPPMISRYCPRRAALLPSFMACRPPTWLWSEDIESPEHLGSFHDEHMPDERLDTVELGGPESLEGLASRDIKDVFDAAAGIEFARLAYKPQYRLARYVGWVCIWGVSTGDEGDIEKEMKQIRDMLDEWDPIKHIQATEVDASWVVFATRLQLFQRYNDPRIYRAGYYDLLSHNHVDWRLS